MSALKGMVTVAAVVAAAGAGLWAGQTGLIKLPMNAAPATTEIAQVKAKGPVIYYRDPSGKPLYALDAEEHRWWAALCCRACR